MRDSGDYKVFGRKKFAFIMLILVSILAPALWMGLDRLAEYGEQLEALAASEPSEAEAVVKRLARGLAIGNGIVLCSFAVVIVLQGWRGWRTASMPPKGTWILEGQRTWSGEPAVRVARFTVVVGLLLAALALASSFILWRLGDTLVS